MSEKNSDECLDTNLVDGSDPRVELSPGNSDRHPSEVHVIEARDSTWIAAEDLKTQVKFGYRSNDVVIENVSVMSFADSLFLDRKHHIPVSEYIGGESTPQLEAARSKARNAKNNHIMARYLPEGFFDDMKMEDMPSSMHMALVNSMIPSVTCSGCDSTPTVKRKLDEAIEKKSGPKVLSASDLVKSFGGFSKYIDQPNTDCLLSFKFSNLTSRDRSDIESFQAEKQPSPPKVPGRRISDGTLDRGTLVDELNDPEYIRRMSDYNAEMVFKVLSMALDFEIPGGTTESQKDWLFARPSGEVNALFSFVQSNILYDFSGIQDFL